MLCLISQKVAYFEKLFRVVLKTMSMCKKPNSIFVTTKKHNYVQYRMYKESNSIFITIKENIN